MKIRTEDFCSHQTATARALAANSNPRARSTRAFTLVEVQVVMLLVIILIAAGIGSILAMDISSRRLGDYTAAMALVEAKIQDIVAATYNPPSQYFKTNTVSITNNNSISLDKAGTTFKVTGTVVSEIKPVASGHLVTVTGTFQEPKKSITVSLQTVVNKFTQGQQQ
jgi:type II secretory pathway pseudopilin PulG